MAWPTPNYYDYDKGVVLVLVLGNNINLLELLVDSQLEVDGSEDFSGDSEAPLSGGGQLEVNIVGDAVAHDLDIELLGGLVQGWRGGGGGSCLGGGGGCRSWQGSRRQGTQSCRGRWWCRR